MYLIRIKKQTHALQLKSVEMVWDIPVNLAYYLNSWSTKQQTWHLFGMEHGLQTCFVWKHLVFFGLVVSPSMVWNYDYHRLSAGGPYLLTSSTKKPWACRSVTKSSTDSDFNVRSRKVTDQKHTFWYAVLLNLSIALLKLFEVNNFKEIEQIRWIHMFTI